MNSLGALSDRVLLVILDGLGIGPDDHKNAVCAARMPHFDELLADYPSTVLDAGGQWVGLPAGVVGNSEVGHMNLGAGRPVRQDLVRIDEAIAKGEYANRPGLRELMAKANGGRVHLMGLLSDGGVHSHMNHIRETARILAAAGLDIYFHAFMDGRDTPRDSGAKYIEELLALPGLRLASMQGRSWGMDRDRRWEKIKACYKTLTGAGELTGLSARQWLEREYAQGRYDEFVSPVLFDQKGAMKGGEPVFFLNFRPDRAIQITSALNLPDFSHFERPWRAAHYLCMTPYIPDEMDLPILFDKERIRGTLAEHLADNKLAQYKIAETEKYAHVTYFFNGGQKRPFPGEKRVLVPSPKDVTGYDQKPQMSAPELTRRLVAALADKDYKFYLANYANPDMVGHTGNFEGAVAALEAVDACLGELKDVCAQENVALILTADHGNCDQMIWPDGEPHTSHTNAPVPFAVFHPRLKGVPLVPVEDAALKDVAPTVLRVMGLSPPASFTGRSVFP